MVPSFRRFELIGALAAIGSDDEWGLVSFQEAAPKLTTMQIVHWLTTELPKVLTPYPGQRSIVVLDNMPSHRAHEAAIEFYIHRAGAIVMWNPPNSLDMNPIEFMWFQLVGAISRRNIDLIHRRPSRTACMGDVVDVLIHERITSAAVRHSVYTSLQHRK